MGEYYLLRWLIPLCIGIATENFFPSWEVPLCSIGVGLLLHGGYACIRDPYLRYKYRNFPLWGKGLTFVAIGTMLLKWENHSLDTYFPIGGQVREVQIVQCDTTLKGKERWRVKIKGTGMEAMLYPKIPQGAIPEVGDCYKGHIIFRKITNIDTSEKFDYRLYMRRRGVTLVGFSSWRDTLVWVGKGKTMDYLLSPRLWGSRCRAYCVHFFQHLPLKKEVQSILIGITLGDKQAMTTEVKEQFRLLGIAHLLAVSGLHVGLLWGILGGLLSFLKCWKIGRNLHLLLIVFGLWGYAMLTGFSPSVCRATLMCTLWAVGKMLHRPYYALYALFLTAFLLLLWNPFNLMEVGFQMSFMAVFFILLGNRIREKYLPYYIGWRGRIVSFVVVSLSAQVGVLPLLLHYFGKFQPLFLLANLVVLPIVPFIMFFTGGMVLFSCVGVPIEFPLYIVEKLTEGIWIFMNFCEVSFQRMEFSFPLSIQGVCGMYFLLIGTALFLAHKRKSFHYQRKKK